MKLLDIIKKNREIGLDDNRKIIKIRLLSNAILNNFEDIIEYYLRVSGVNASVSIGQFDNIVQESQDSASFDVVIVFWELGGMAPDLPARSLSHSDDEARALEKALGAQVGQALSGLSQANLVLFNRFSSILFDAEPLRTSPLNSMAGSLNAVLNAANMDNLIVVDIDQVIAQAGVAAAFDRRGFYAAAAPYTVAFMERYAQAIIPAVGALCGIVKKAVILDCDNTLWGGVIGEDGLDGIKLGDTSPAGKVFAEVQHLLKGLQSTGAILALCSKNNAADVEDVLANHQGMVLKSNDFVIKKVNWDSKDRNIEAIARELNIGLDSMVFVDDSDFEIELVKKRFPQVTCVKVPEEIEAYPLEMRRLHQLFFTMNRTAEDAARTQMYLEDRGRQELAETSANMEDYLRSLQIKVSPTWGADIPLARAAQMSQKTNQFNLTTLRYAEADLVKMLASDRYLVGTFGVSDCFGSSGVTALVVITVEGADPGQSAADRADIETWLMSCRIIGRNIEIRVFDEILRMLQARGVAEITARYSRTAKNGLVKDFYEGLGFDVVKENENEKAYRLRLNDYEFGRADYIEVI